MDDNIKCLIGAIIAACIAVTVSITGGLYSFNSYISDAVFQQESALSGDIVIIGIDNKSLNEMGPLNTWTRSDMANIINILNSEKDNKPAAIGIDIMYFGNTTEEDDYALAEASRRAGNVIVASSVTFGTDFKENDHGDFYVEDYVVKNIEYPYDSLRAVTRQGHINAIADRDGIIRSSLHSINIGNNKFSNSFAYEVYKEYSEYMGIDIGDGPSLERGNEWYIPFSSKAGGYYDGISFVDVLTGEISADIFKDKIVLIGPYAPGLLDSYRVPIDYSSYMYGVEIHANTIEALMNGNFKKYAPEGLQHVVLFLVIFITYIFFRYLTTRYACLWLLLLTIIYMTLAASVYEWGYILDVVYIPTFTFIVFIYMAIRHYVVGLIERKAIVNTFKKYIAPEFVEQIFSGQPQDEGKCIDISCMFVDIRGFTSIAETISPNEIVDILNEYFNLMGICITNYNGTIDKFIGDAVMAIFNAPVPIDDYVYKSVCAAHSIISTYPDLAHKLLEKYGFELKIGIGINCGEAVVGNIGTNLRMDYTAVGDVVNVASRLESFAGPSEILITRNVYDAVRGRIDAECMGKISIKGKSEEMEIFSVKDVF